jgi:CRP/FNR family transcriptional regulator, cyclic AMP receptor protein
MRRPTAARFAALRARHPQVDRVLVAMLADNVRRLSGQVLEALYVPVDERVARRLHELAEVYGAEVPVTQDDLAGMAGTTRASANLALRRLADSGVVALGRGRIVVRHLPALRRAAQVV